MHESESSLDAAAILTLQSLDEESTLLLQPSGGPEAGQAGWERAGPEDVWRWRRQLLGNVARFAGPALCIPLADPLMSLIDSVAVGQVRLYCAETCAR